MIQIIKLLYQIVDIYIFPVNTLYCGLEMKGKN